MQTSDKSSEPPLIPDRPTYENAPKAPTQTKAGLSPWKIVLPLIILIGAVFAVRYIVSTKPEPEGAAPPPREEAVEAISVQPSVVQLSVQSQGTVRPRVQTQLTAEVAGRIEEVSPNFRPGGFIKQGEMLVRIDAVDYQAALATARASLAQARFNLSQEQALAEQAQADWDDLGSGEPTDLALRIPQLEQAQASIESAEATLRRTERDLERTEVRAPYTGRVLEQSVDIGQFVSGNMSLGVIYSTDTVEVFLPVDDAEISRLSLPSNLDEPGVLGPPVTLSATFGGRSYKWDARLVRSGAAFDQRSRLLDMVAEVNDPLATDDAQPNRPPLKPGMFVKATIEGRTVDGSFVIPRRALREGDTVLVAQADDTLARRVVDVVQADTKSAIIAGGLEPGDRVITSPLEYVVEGMKLKVSES